MVPLSAFYLRWLAGDRWLIQLLPESDEKLCALGVPARGHPAEENVSGLFCAVLWFSGPLSQHLRNRSLTCFAAGGKTALTCTLQLWPSLHISQRVQVPELQEFLKAFLRGLEIKCQSIQMVHMLLNSDYHFSKGVSFYLTFCSVCCKVKSIN